MLSHPHSHDVATSTELLPGGHLASLWIGITLSNVREIVFVEVPTMPESEEHIWLRVKALKALVANGHGRAELPNGGCAHPDRRRGVRSASIGGLRDPRSRIGNWLGHHHGA